MVDTATFSMFHRSPPRGPAAPDAPEPRREEAEPGLPRPDMRARRRAVRDAMRQPDPAPPPAAPAPTQPKARREPDASLSLSPGYQLLSLADPLVCSLTGALRDAVRVRMTLGDIGIACPGGSADGLTGLATGTRVLTGRGEVAVEQLAPGDTALALRGMRLLPIVAIHRSVATAPLVQILAGAFGPNRPNQTLRVGARHLVCIETEPVAALDLVNGGAIRTLDLSAAGVFHVDFGMAEILLAEGLPLASG